MTNSNIHLRAMIHKESKTITSLDFCIYDHPIKTELRFN